MTSMRGAGASDPYAIRPSGPPATSQYHAGMWKVPVTAPETLPYIV